MTSGIQGPSGTCPSARAGRTALHTNAPEAVRAAAARAGRTSRPVDLLLLRRVRDALARLHDSDLIRHCFEIPGDSLASPRGRQDT
jgi:hypothetical protein